MEDAPAISGFSTSAGDGGDYARIEAAILFIEQNVTRQPELKEIARHVHLSEFHFQRLFTRWAGISPKRFLQILTLDYSKRLLAQSQSVLSASLDAGLSGPSRLHDLFVSIEAVTPGEFKARGCGLRIRHGFHATPFGTCLLAATNRGICELSFVAAGNETAALAELSRNWPEAELAGDPAGTRPLAEQVFSSARAGSPLKIFCRGTNFQARVWNALLRIPPGAVVSYEAVAQQIGAPSAARAVGSAVGRNRLAYLIPCHRVINKLGITGSYRWGSARKKAMLAWEAARQGGED